MGCFQGSTEALRSIQQPTHFTDFVISHSHLTVFGTFVVWAMGGLVYVWPRACGRELWSFTMGNWAFWLITVGISTMGLVLTAAGLQQGFQWMAGTEWLDTVLVDATLLAGAHRRRHQHGHRHVASRHQSDDDGAGPAGRSGGTSGIRCGPDSGWWGGPMSARFVTLVAGIFCFFAALITQGFLPFFEPSARTNRVTAVVRTDFGQLKWMMTEATDYTPLQQLGRDVYLREGCWYCHSQFVRPVTGETRRWGPVTEFGRIRLRRAAPVRHAAHRTGSDAGRTQIQRRMASRPFLESAHAVAGLDHGALSGPLRHARAAGQDRRRRSRQSHAGKNAGHRRAVRLREHRSRSRLTPNADGLLFVPMRARGKTPVIVIPNEEYKGDTVRIAAETKDLEGLIAYVQKLGMNRGKWRDLFEPQQLEVTEATMPRSTEWIAHGQEVYERRCLGCHGVNGDGNGPAATFLTQAAPAELRGRGVQVPADQGAAADRR